MPRIRTIKPEFWCDAKIVRLSPFARLLFIGTWNWACDRGHLPDDPEDLALKVLPRDPVDAEALVQELVDARLVERIDSAESGPYLRIRKFTDHQKTDSRWPVRCPFCPTRPTENPDVATVGFFVATENPDVATEILTMERKGKEISRAAPEGATGKTAPPKPPPPGAELFDAIADACRWDTSQLTRDARGRLNAAVKQLRELGATPDDVHKRARAYRAKYPDTELTPQALTGNWASLNGARASGTKPDPPPLPKLPPPTEQGRAQLAGLKKQFAGRLTIPTGDDT